MTAHQESWDVIVVGGGGSGLAAAYRIAEKGGRVLVLEKQPQWGGTTGIAVGTFTSSGTSMQRAAGISDNAAAHAEDAGQFAPADIEARNNGPLRDWFLSETATTFEWLCGLGLSFFGPSPEPPNRVPRMHNVVPGAKAYIAALQLGIVRLGGVIRLERYDPVGSWVAHRLGLDQRPAGCRGGNERGRATSLKTVVSSCPSSDRRK
ncbi:MAG: FAD-dependent oxidoreductase [Gemmataceae bacterium]